MAKTSSKAYANPHGHTDREVFQCDCHGPTRILSHDHVVHACGHKSSPATSYYDGIQRFISYKRVQVNPALCGGLTKYNWFVDWQS